MQELAAEKNTEKEKEECHQAESVLLLKRKKKRIKNRWHSKHQKRQILRTKRALLYQSTWGWIRDRSINDR
jgi:hypothetical protein